MRWYFLICFLLLLTGCTNYFYWPSREMVSTPGQLGIKYEDVEISAPDEPTLHGWFIPAQDIARGTVVFLHGNAGNISTHWMAAGWLPEYQYNVILIDYRGYGLSGGANDIDQIHDDFKRIVEYVRARKDVDPGRLILFGQSIGATMALYIAGKQEYRDVFQAVVADSPFASYRQIAREKLRGHWLTWLLSWPLGFLVDDGYSPIRYTSKIAIPTLMLSCSNDGTVPASHAVELCNSLVPLCSYIHKQGCDHIGALESEETRHQMLVFMNNALSKEKRP
jgi:pimeloyl-ACP methyl ester carboxylesterase